MRLPQGNQNQNQPCTGITGAIQDFTGGDSNQSFVDDVVNNFVDTKETLASSVAETALTLGGGGTVAQTWGGVTPLNAVRQAVGALGSEVSIPGLIGFRTVPQLLFTTGVTWATSAFLIKGVYNAGVLAGSIYESA